MVNGEWEGMTATVISDGSNSDASLGPNEVLVRPSFSSHAWNDIVLANIDPMQDKALILRRQEIAIWDFDRLYDDGVSESMPATSIENSRQKVNSLLSKLDSVSQKKKKQTSAIQKKGTNSFQSSRQRKAA